MGLLDYLSPALTVATNAVAAHDLGARQKQERDTNSMLALLKLQREQQDQETDDAYKKSQTRHANAQATEAEARTRALGRQKIRAITDNEGNTTYYTDTVEPGATPTTGKLPGVTGTTKDATMVPSASGMVTTRGAKPGQATVVTEDKTGKVVRPVPRPPPRGSSGAPGMDLVHRLSTLNTQLAEANRGLASARTLAKPLNDQIDSSFTTGGGLTQAQAARESIRHWQARVDSLTKERDRVAAQQAGQRVERVLPPGPVSDSAAPAGVRLQETKRRGIAPVVPRTRVQDSTDVEADYQAIMRSNAPAEVKAQAQRLYRQHLLELKSTAQPEHPAGDDDGS